MNSVNLTCVVVEAPEKSNLRSGDNVMYMVRVRPLNRPNTNNKRNTGSIQLVVFADRDEYVAINDAKVGDILQVAGWLDCTSFETDDKELRSTTQLRAMPSNVLSVFDIEDLAKDTLANNPVVEEPRRTSRPSRSSRSESRQEPEPQRRCTRDEEPEEPTQRSSRSSRSSRDDSGRDEDRRSSRSREPEPEEEAPRRASRSSRQEDPPRNEEEEAPRRTVTRRRRDNYELVEEEPQRRESRRPVEEGERSSRDSRKARSSLPTRGSGDAEKEPYPIDDEVLDSASRYDDDDLPLPDDA